MCEVTVKIGGNASKYWASLEFDDAKGKTHRKEIARERSATKSSNTLQALIDALGILRNPCVLTIYTEDDALAAAWSNGWVNTWQQHSWKNAKGNTIRNAEQWQQLYELMKPHGRRFVCGTSRGVRVLELRRYAEPGSAPYFLWNPCQKKVRTLWFESASLPWLPSMGEDGGAWRKS